MFIRRSKRVPEGKRLALSEKFTRLVGRLKDPEWRRYGGLLLAGKMLGIACIFFLVFGLPAILTAIPKVITSEAQAATPAPKAATPAAAPKAAATPAATPAAAPKAAPAAPPSPAAAPKAAAAPPAAAPAAPPAPVEPPAKTPAIPASTPIAAAPKTEPAADPKKDDSKAEVKSDDKAASKDGDAKPDAPADATPPDPLTVPLDTKVAGDIVNPINTMWTLVAAFLVFGMQAGFTMLEAGFCRSRETVNVLMECVVDTCLCGLLFFAFGYAFMFGHGNGFIGWGGPPDADGKITNWFFLANIPKTYEASGVALLAHWIFQFAFADCASTICSGAMIGRTGFVGDLLYSLGVSGFIYPIIGHWAWGPDGFLATMGTPDKDHAWRFLENLGMNFHDFAGSTVVHTIGGTIALAGAIVLGPRLGRKFKRDGGGPMMPHDLTVGVIGGFILWFGWYGFNPGSTLSAMDFEGIGRIAANTTLAACAAGLTAMFANYIPTKKWDASFTTNGFLAGLVAITCPCYWVDPLGAVALGAVAGVIVYLGVELLEYLRIDDPIGAVPVHMINGIWGTISLGLFACGKYNAGGSGSFAPDMTAKDATPLTGLFYHGGPTVLYAQIIGNAVITLSTFAAAMILMKAVDAMGYLRVSKEGELYGLDLHEHGISAYPEYQIWSSHRPEGMKDI